DGARSPWNWVPNGPAWQRMQVVLRSSTSARPRAASPGAPVSDCGMPSPTILYGASVCACTAQARASAARQEAIWTYLLANIIRRAVLAPVDRLIRLSRADLARRIDRARGAAFDFGEDALPGHIDAGKRKGVARRNRVVADARQSRSFRHLACQRVDDGSR